MERVKVNEAAEILGVSQQYVRIGMQRGWLPIGSCVKLSSKWTYHISRDRLNAYLAGKDLFEYYFDPAKQKNAAPRQQDGTTTAMNAAERT